MLPELEACFNRNLARAPETEWDGYESEDEWWFWEFVVMDPRLVPRTAGIGVSP